MDDHLGDGRLLPARMVNEVAYCPRLFYLEWVDHDFEDNHFTVDGRVTHRRIDEGEARSAVGAGDTPWVARSVELSSDTLGVIGRMDVVEADGTGAVTPVETKRGEVPDVPEGAYEPERVQLCLYGLLLREQGHHVPRGEIYFAGSRRRVTVEFDEELVKRTLQLVDLARSLTLEAKPPPPLVASPRCNGCSLAPLCLPDEVNHLLGVTEAEPRPARPARDDAQPLYVQEAGARVGISGRCLEVTSRDRTKLMDAPLVDVSHVVLWGNVQISSQAIRELAGQGIPVVWLSTGGWLSGLLDGLGHGQVALRRIQYDHAFDEGRALPIARTFIAAKIANCRTILRRNLEDPPASVLHALAQLAHKAEEVGAMDELLGIEGSAARVYFEAFGQLLRTDELGTFDFSCRNRRPPKDPVNAMLSFLYSILAKDLAIACRIVGFDPYVGFFHRPRPGRFSLALDLMEEFRPLLADSVVLSAINTRTVGRSDFIFRGVGVTMNAEGRKKLLRAWERRLAELITHPVFGYRVSYRRVLEIQCRLLARSLRGEIPAYPPIRTR